MNKEKITISDLTRANRKWFGSCDFMGTVLCKVVEKNDKQYLMEKTNKWSDMFGEPKEIFFIIRKLNGLEIGKTIKEFKTQRGLDKWLNS